MAVAGAREQPLMKVVVQPYLISHLLYHTIVRMPVEPSRISIAGRSSCMMTF